MQRNRLAAESSPYLLQHADNPVDWHPWNDAALALARHENKPILLSVGYSACHWCHVMAHESFQDLATASVMNRLFVNIKVDREERPDLDKIYQQAQQLITRHSGGWPLTMFLTPAQEPFFGGTYFPRESRHGLPAFRDLLERVAEYFHTHQAEIGQQNVLLKLALQRLLPDPVTSHVELQSALLQDARDFLASAFDQRFGGFGTAPKFPQTGAVERCLRHWYATSRERHPDLNALYMATLTLTRMAEGGIYDQLGGGFARYSVDAHWTIPHFEKMLYDNGLLLYSYAQAALATGEALYVRVANETADWLLRHMHSPAGGFYSSLDADSEGHEGKFYVGDREEVQALLPPLEYALLAQHFGLDQAANFDGSWHLRVRVPLDSLTAHATDPAPVESAAARTVVESIDSGRRKLLAAREMRVWPARDEKILTAWNALTIKGLALAGRVLGRSDLTAAASNAVDFIRAWLWRDGRLLATVKDGRAHLPAYLDDYAFLADALLELLQTRWRREDMEFAITLLDSLLDKFQDPGGGFFFTASDHEMLFHRGKSFGDDSLPSGNGVAAATFCRAGYLLGDVRYLEAAERTLMAASKVMTEQPERHMTLLNALGDFLTSTQVVIIRGHTDEAGRWAREIQRLYAPTRMVFAIPNDVAALPSGLADRRAGKTTTAYVCTGMTCSPPLTDPRDLADKLAVQVTL